MNEGIQQLFSKSKIIPNLKLVFLEKSKINDGKRHQLNVNLKLIKRRSMGKLYHAKNNPKKSKLPLLISDKWHSSKNKEGYQW